MAFKAAGNAPKARLEQLTKAQLVKTVKTLQKRETKLLNEIAKLQAALGPFSTSPAATPAETLANMTTPAVYGQFAQDAATIRGDEPPAEVPGTPLSVLEELGVVHVTQDETAAPVFPWNAALPNGFKGEGE